MSMCPAKMDRLRESVLLDLDKNYLPKYQHLLEDRFTVSFDYYRGWSKEKELKQLLLDTIDSDLKQGFTHVGPQKADFRIRSSKGFARDFLSRGQTKALVIALKLAQLEQLMETKQTETLLLIDDFQSELDPEFRKRFVESLLKFPCQLLVTGIDKFSN